MGIARVSLPSIIIFAVIKSMKNVLEGVKQEWSFQEIEKELIDYDYLRNLLED